MSDQDIKLIFERISYYLKSRELSNIKKRKADDKYNRINVITERICSLIVENSLEKTWYDLVDDECDNDSIYTITYLLEKIFKSENNIRYFDRLIVELFNFKNIVLLR